ncbi:MAG: STAS domain-containing protein [Planctomycetota bacterium]
MSTVETQGTQTVVKPETNIVSTMTQDFQRELKDLIDKGQKTLTLDLTGVNMIDSIGLGLLIATHNTLSKQGGKLVVIHASGDLLSLFRTMRLDKHFDVSGD